MAGGRVDRIIVGELGDGQVLVPVITKLVDVGTEDLLDRTVSTFALAISLRVISRREPKRSTQGVVGSTPKVAREAGIPVRDDSVLQTVSAEDGFEVDVGYVVSITSLLGRLEHSHLGESVHEGDDCIIALLSPRQISDEVHGHLLPGLGRKRNRLKESRRLVLRILDPLTGVTGARTSLWDGLPAFLNRVRTHTDLPLVVGFGISTPEHVRTVAQAADGAIVASALINLMDQVDASQRVTKVVEYLKTLRPNI